MPNEGGRALRSRSHKTVTICPEIHHHRKDSKGMEAKEWRAGSPVSIPLPLFLCLQFACLQFASRTPGVAFLENGAGEGEMGKNRQERAENPAYLSHKSRKSQ